MKLRALSAAVLVPLLRSAAADTNPISKVIQLISDLQAKIVADGEQAQKVFHEFSEWCEERSANVAFEIKTGKTEIADLKAAIDNSAAQIGAAESKIEDLARLMSTDEADLKSAQEIRAKEAADFAAEEKDLVEAVDSIERAIGLIEREMRKKGGALVQFKHSNDLLRALSAMVDASMINSQDASRLTALVQRSKQDDGLDDDPPPGAPAAAAYESHSDGILGALEDLLDKAKDQLESARKKEVTSRHNFEMLEQSLKDEVKNAEKEMDEEKKALAAAGNAKASAEGDLQVTSKALAEDVETQGSLHRECMERSQDFEAETKSRAEELKALAEAKKVIVENTAGAESVAYGDEASSFLQTDSMHLSVSSRADLIHFEALQLVRSLAKKSHDNNLSLLAKRMAAAMRSAAVSGADPFAKVKGMIRDMLEKLLKEAGSDASHKAYCDKEMAETAAKLEDKNAAVEKLSTQIDSMTAKTQRLTEDVAALQKALAELAASQASMDKIRAEEREVFTKNKADAEQGLEAVKVALKVLRDYYAKEADHEAASGAGNGIIGMLEVVESDLTKSLAEMGIEEQTAQSEYDRQTQENKISKATKTQSVKYKTKELKTLDVRTAEAKSDLEAEHTELAAVQEYSAKLDKTCVAKPETYEERKRRREAEIAGLKEALEILKGEAALLQQQKRGALRGRPQTQARLAAVAA